MYPNLEAEMIRSSISSEMVAKAIGKSYNTARAKISGRKGFTLDEAWMIKNKLFPDYTVDYLFEEKEA